MFHPKFILWSVATLSLAPGFLLAADLALQSPRDYQVFQRTERAVGTVKLHGRAQIEAARWQYRFSGKDSAGSALPAHWQDFPSGLQKQGFEFLVTVPSGGWYHLEVRGINGEETVVSASVEHVGVGEVFVVAGQSNAGNYGSEKQRPQSGLVVNFDGKAWALADDPQRGAGGGGGSFLPAFGDALVGRLHVPVGLVPLAVGATSVREWLPEGVKFPQQTTTGKGVRATVDGQWESTGLLFKNLTDRISTFGNRGLRAVLWHQGESDAGQARGGYPADRQISGAQYVDFMRQLVAASQKSSDVPLPWFSAQTTYHSEQDSADAEFREAMQSLWRSGVTLEGPDTDALGKEFRAGVHFNGTGLKRHGELWAEKVTPWLEGQLLESRREGPPTSEYKLVWSDEFDGDVLDSKKWKHRYTGPRKDGFNVTSAVQLDGKGHLRITCDKVGERYETGMICTSGLYEARYGYFEARVQMQTQEGWWPGFWLSCNSLGNPDKGTGAEDDTAHNGTEIDVFEYLRIRGDRVQHAMHWNGYGKLHKSTGRHVQAPGLGVGFHTIGCEWTPDKYVYYVDGRRTWETSEAVSGVPEFIILSGEISSWPGVISKARLPDAVVYDYVRVWQKP